MGNWRKFHKEEHHNIALVNC